VVLQFSISIFLIVCVGVVSRQLEYFRSKDLGYQKEHVVIVPLRGESKQWYRPLKQLWSADARIHSVCGHAASMPYFGWSSGTVDWEGKDPNREVLIHFNLIDTAFIDTYDIPLVEGRNFSADFPADLTSAFVINEEMAHLIPGERDLGKRITFWNQEGRVIGVVKNFHFQPLNTEIKPLALMLRKDNFWHLSVRLQPGDIQNTMEFLRQVWEKTVSGFPFDYRFLDEAFDSRYRGIERLGNLATTFTLLAIFIACMGLYGLSSFTTSQRTREIGIRKVLGASVPGIVMMLSKELTRCVLLANLIAWPAAYLAMRSWLADFAYRIDIEILLFIQAAVLALVIALLTVGYQTVRAALANPAVSLKYE
jgi:hypothetical protein